MQGLRLILSSFFWTVIAVAPLNILAASTPQITSSVKLRVDDKNGHEWGTGTIIDTRSGPEGQDALIVTCGHIFQAWGPQFSKEQHGNRHVEVHLYGENSTVKVYGRCLYYDTEIDLALVCITPPGQVHVAPLAPADYRIQPSQQTWSVGCDQGGNPSIQTHQVLSVDKYSTSREKRVQFNYVHVSGAPVSGRSGGGLFSAEGYLIGVCNTGDPARNDGHFVPPQMIRYILEQTIPAEVCRDIYQKSQPAVAALAPLAPIAMVAAPAPMVAANMTSMSREEQATLEEIKRWQQDGDEIILIRRSRRNPEIPSDVIMLNGTSTPFMDALVKGSPANPSYNQVILSSQDERQPVSFPVRY